MELPFYIDFTNFQNNYKQDFVLLTETNREITLSEYYEYLKHKYTNAQHTLNSQISDLEFLKEIAFKRLEEQMRADGTEITSVSKEIEEYNKTYLFPKINELGTDISGAIKTVNNIIGDIAKIIGLIRFEIATIPPNENNNTHKQTKLKNKTNLSTPEKIALLEHLGVFAKLYKDGVRAEDVYRIIESLLGDSNSRKYCLNLKNNNKSYPNEYQITDKHREKVKNFYNSKTL